MKGATEIKHEKEQAKGSIRPNSFKMFSVQILSFNFFKFNFQALRLKVFKRGETAEGVKFIDNLLKKKISIRKFNKTEQLMEHATLGKVSMAVTSSKLFY